MLITIYNDQNSTHFSQDFAENVILPKNSTLKLTNALIPLSHNFVVAEAKTLKLKVNDKRLGVGATNDCVINAGTYTLDQLAHHIRTTFQTSLDANKARCKILISYDETQGYAPNVFKIQIQAESLNYNQQLFFAWGTANFSAKFRNSKNAVLIDTLTRQSAYVADPESNVFGCKTLQKTGADIQTWAWNFNLNMPLQFWNDPDAIGGDNKPPSIHNVNSPYASVSWLNQGTSTNYIVCLSNGVGVPNSSFIADNNFDKYINIQNVANIILVVNQTNGAFTAGEVYLYEWDGGSMSLVGKYEDVASPINDQTEFGISLQEGQPPLYSMRKNGSTTWEHISINNGAVRWNVDAGHAYTFTYSSYGATGNSDTDANIANLVGTFKPDDIPVEDFGQFIQFGFNGNTELQEDLGFDNATYTDDKTGTNDKADLQFSNEDKIAVQGEELGLKKVPYVNFQIASLPIVSYSNTDTEQQGLTCSKTLASIPRYDEMGNYENVNNLTYAPTIPNEIKLNNAEEIVLSRLDFKLQQADGSYPVDLSLPQAYVIDVQSESNGMGY